MSTTTGPLLSPVMCAVSYRDTTWYSTSLLYTNLNSDLSAAADTELATYIESGRLDKGDHKNIYKTVESWHYGDNTNKKMTMIKTFAMISGSGGGERVQRVVAAWAMMYDEDWVGNNGGGGGGYYNGYYTRHLSSLSTLSSSSPSPSSPSPSPSPSPASVIPLSKSLLLDWYPDNAFFQLPSLLRYSMGQVVVDSQSKESKYVYPSLFIVDSQNSLVFSSSLLDTDLRVFDLDSSFWYMKAPKESASLSIRSK